MPQMCGDRLLERRADIADIAAERDQRARHVTDAASASSMMPTSSKIAAIGACGLCTVIFTARMRGKCDRMASATAPAARSSSL